VDIIKQKKGNLQKNEIKTLLVELIEAGIMTYKNKEYSLSDFMIEALENENKINKRHEKGFWYTKEGFLTVFDGKANNKKDGIISYPSS